MRIISICLLLSCSSCSIFRTETVIPETVIQKQASFDGSEQNSGLIGYEEGRGFELTSAAVLRYKNLAKVFGTEVIGLSVIDGKNFINEEGMVDFMNLSDRKNNK
jgi:hypothetical protein